ncbi:TetR/AcrR family transcriptional regulator [Saccharomonospora piscinae]|uniref:TetR/AcrR family transcriptional regulator n=1 Tax=Saccharomonospora piscinae TaxID=687388 RepID=UPI0004631666|nr:TetR/AcrR family transcriptional regulator [Saccharomonospora piscinae]
MTRPRKLPSQQRSRFTYEVVLQAAARVFDAEGMAATTNRIAERAGVSVGSLYQYFPNKQALLHELTSRHLDHAEKAFAVPLARIRTTPPELEAVVAELVSLAVEENTPLATAHRAMREHTPRSREIERRFRRLADLVVDGLVAYLDPPDRRHDESRLRARLVVAGLDNQIHQVVLDGGSPEERAARTRLVIEHTVPVLRSGSFPR